IGVGLAIVVVMGGILENQPLAIYGVVIAGAALGFLKLNWHPAKVFMGDVGSVPLGFLLGWLLLSLAASGQWAAALILPSYYLSDATVTILRRALRGEKIWRPHRLHFYQAAVQRGLDHGAVSLQVLSVNGALVILAAVAASDRQMEALVIAGLLNIAFLFRLARGRSKGRSKGRGQ
ncbi:MAG TPA: glycosyl transferase, partial [Rhodospirillales bacterium]|nr:glycosyl transferase [Rhodospirillales bacterium]